MNNLKPERLIAFRNQADILLKRAKFLEKESLNRFLKINSFKDKELQWLIHHVDVLKLKHSYQVVATEHGFNTWLMLRDKVVENDCLYNANAVAFVHAWFQKYETAKVYHRKNGGYLLSFWNDFIVCGDEYIHRLDLHDPGKWDRIGFDWHMPGDTDSYNELRTRAHLNYLSKNK